MYSLCVDCMDIIEGHVQTTANKNTNCMLMKKQMILHKCRGSIRCLIGSMRGTIANRGFLAPEYNSSKAAVIQLARNLAIKWSPINIRVNTVSLGHIVTPMVEENFRNGEASRKEWENNTMLGRLSRPEKYQGAGVFLWSDASSYMTGHDIRIDGGTLA